jgi:hypothetical protein
MRSPRHMTIAAVVGLVLLVGACTEPTPVEENPITAHPEDWSVPGKTDFHGARVAREGTVFCTSCHGSDLRGVGIVPGCYDCHEGPGGHPTAWASRPTPLHETAVQHEGTNDCRTCHGNDYRGGWSTVSCYTCHAGGPSGHPEGWMNPDASTFHGLRVAVEGDNDCRRCHGNDLLGGTSGVACGDCHF